MRYSYLKPKLRDLSQGARITFVRQFRGLTQDEVSSKLGVTGNSKEGQWLDMKVELEIQKKTGLQK